MAQQELAADVESRSSEQHTATMPDGAKLVYRVWPPNSPSNKAVLLFHRGHEHSGRFQELVDQLEMGDYWIFAWDARGHGLSEGERGYAESFSQLVGDVDCFVRSVSQEYNVPIENMAVLANSVGAVVVSAWVHDYAPSIRAMVLATPAFRVKLYVPLAIPSLRLLQCVKRRSFIKSYVRPTMLTHDQQMVRQYADDPLITRNIAVNILLDLYDASTRIVADAGAIYVPTLVLSAGSDWVVHVGPQRRFFKALSSETKEIEVYEGFYHSIFHEEDRHRPIAKTREFLQRAFDLPLEKPSLLDADRQGYTKACYDRLCRPLPIWSPRRWNFAAIKLFMNTLGKMSRGIRIGGRHGFSSGEALDHVYRNRAEGFTPLGKLIDRCYLNSIGWRGIRQRKVNLEKVLDEAIQKIHQSGQEVRLLDIASGPGRYLLETVKKHSQAGIKISAMSRDRDTSGLETGRKLAEEMGVGNVEYREGDAFNETELSEIQPRPNIAVVSGLYELFPENENVAASLRGLGKTVPEGGYLIYTNQPWHPQLDLIAHSLGGLDGSPWIMRCRTQAEMDQLVAAAGFEKISTIADQYGIFSVSLARRSAEK